MDDLQSKIELSMNIHDAKVRQLLIFGLNDALAYNNQVGEITNHGIGVNEFWYEIDKIVKALRKLASKKGTPVAAYNSINQAMNTNSISDTYWELIDQEAYSIDKTRWEQTKCIKSALESLNKKPSIESNQFLLEVFESFYLKRNKPGKGLARKQAKTHLMAIQKLAQWFSDTLKQNPSSNADSLFYRYVEIYFVYIAKNSEIENFQRHIKNALEFQWQDLN